MIITVKTLVDITETLTRKGPDAKLDFYLAKAKITWSESLN